MCFISLDVLWSYSRLTHSRRPSGRQCRYRFCDNPCMALGKDPCEQFSPTQSSEPNLTDSTRLSPSNTGTIHCLPRMSRRFERILPRQLDLCSRGSLVVNPVVATQTRATCSSQTFASRSSAPTIHVLNRSRLHTTLTTYLSSRPESAVNSGTRKGCVRYNGEYINPICIIYFAVVSVHGPLGSCINYFSCKTAGTWCRWFITLA